MKFYYPIQVLLSILGIIFPVPLPADDFSWQMIQLEKNDKRQDTELEDLKKSIDALKLAIRCPCPRGGVCICGEDCVCPNCPKHSKAAKTSPKESYPIAWKPGLPTYTGREYLYFGASWCVNCPAAEKRLGNLISQIFYIDCSDRNNQNPIAQRFGVSALPTALLLVDGKIKSQCSGNDVNQLIVGDWLKGMEFVQSGSLSAGAGVTLGNGKPSAPAATSDDFIPKPIAKSSPQYSYSRTGYNPVQRCSVTRLGGTRWTWPGNLGSHLSSAHGFNPAGFSHSQLVTIHDNFHNTGRSGVTRSGGTYATRPAVQYARQTYQPHVYYSSGSYCPNCPR